MIIHVHVARTLITCGAYRLIKEVNVYSSDIQIKCTALLNYTCTPYSSAHMRPDKTHNALMGGLH